MRSVIIASMAALGLAACDPTGNRASLNDIGSTPAANPVHQGTPAIPPSAGRRAIGLAVATPNGDVRAYHARLEYCERQNARSDAALQARMEREAAMQAGSGSTIRVELRGADVENNQASFRRCLAAAGYSIQ